MWWAGLSYIRLQWRKAWRAGRAATAGRAGKSGESACGNGVKWGGSEYIRRERGRDARGHGRHVLVGKGGKGWEWVKWVKWVGKW
jgi:hypothetical protein